MPRNVRTLGPTSPKHPTTSHAMPPPPEWRNSAWRPQPGTPHSAEAGQGPATEHSNRLCHLAGRARRSVHAARLAPMTSSTSIPWNRLRVLAANASLWAHAPYSGLHVGAAGLVDDGRMVSGCNVENASYGLTLCAECSLVSDLHRTGGGQLVAVVTVDSSGGYLAPCGRCRQLLLEAGGTECLVNEHFTVGEMLPGSFGPADLPVSSRTEN